MKYLNNIFVQILVLDRNIYISLVILFISNTHIFTHSIESCTIPY